MNVHCKVSDYNINIIHLMFGMVTTLPIFHPFPSFIHVPNIRPDHQIFYLHGKVYYNIILYVCGKNMYIKIPLGSRFT
jgi:hypothetical protein